jgi:hypothetical protein
MLLGEVPAAPALAGATITLTLLLAFVVAWGLIQVSDALVRALFGTVSGVTSWIPWLGSKISGSVHDVERRITQFLGGQVDGIDARIAHYFHTLAFEIEWFGRELKQAAELSFALAAIVADLTKPSEWKKLWHSLVGQEKATLQRVKVTQAQSQATAKKVAHANTGEIGAAIHTVTKPIAGELHGLDTWVRPRVKTLEHEVAGVLEPEYARLRDRTKTLEQEALRAFEWAKGKWKVIGVGAVTAAVTVALSRLGLGWIRCRNVGQVGRRLCGMDPSLLESLLAGTIILTSGFSIVQLAEETLAIEDRLVGFVKSGVKELRAF